MGKSLFQTLLTNVPQITTVIQTNTLASIDGSADVLENVDTKDIVSPNSVVKYVNILLQSNVTDTAPAEYGYIEYAIIAYQNETATPTVPAAITSAMTTQSLMDVCRNYFRGNCLYTDVFSMPATIPAVNKIVMKLPLKATKMKRGSHLMLILNFRSRDSTDTTSVSKTIINTMYKAYL